jgi:hypothetical protein
VCAPLVGLRLGELRLGRALRGKRGDQIVLRLDEFGGFE